MKFISVATRRAHISVDMMEEMKNPKTIDIEYDLENFLIKIKPNGEFKIEKQSSQMSRLNISLNKIMKKGKYVYKSTTKDGGFIFEKSIE